MCVEMTAKRLGREGLENVDVCRCRTPRAFFAALFVFNIAAWPLDSSRLQGHTSLIVEYRQTIISFMNKFIVLPR